MVSQFCLALELPPRCRSTLEASFLRGTPRETNTHNGHGLCPWTSERGREFTHNMFCSNETTGDLGQQNELRSIFFVKLVNCPELENHGNSSLVVVTLRRENGIVNSQIFSRLWLEKKTEVDHLQCQYHDLDLSAGIILLLFITLTINYLFAKLKESRERTTHSCQRQIIARHREHSDES